MAEVRIAVIGAGIAGLACAHELARADASVTVFERSRGLGGRLATRRQGDLAFDHGAQFLTARSRAFVNYAQLTVRAGVLDAWRPRIVEDGRTHWPAPIEDWWIGTPGMSALVRPLARNLDIQTGVAVHELLSGQRGWELQTDSGRENGVFRAVAVAVPAPQAQGLLGPHGRSFRHLNDVRMAPCWTGMFAFDRPLDFGVDVMRWTQGPLVWAASNSSKPGRLPRPQCWVVHASSTWSRERLEVDSQQMARQLLEAFTDAVGVALPAPSYAIAHRWRHALVERPLGMPCLVDEETNAGACGDWCIAPRVETAYESGRALAHSLLSMVGLSARVGRR
ncbi:MAG TPA: FAD-dependent oxidoreductase [Steroidobacteraceae bacterium]|nr:FAD-dependent oxidoreductase [Steroidobacteraceae bacterium]